MTPPSAETACPLCPGRHQALVVLLEAHETASELGRPVWDLACQLPSLHALGATDSALRWLVERCYAEHRLEITARRRPQRTFRRAANLRFGPRSCFVLTERGVALARRSAVSPRSSVPHASHAGGQVNGLKPRWDADRRILWLGDRVVKQFKQPAANQELILRAFEEEGWPVHLDDPLPPRDEMDSKKRLHDTIKRMNRQQAQTLRFGGDGFGRGVLWSVDRFAILSIKP